MIAEVAYNPMVAAEACTPIVADMGHAVGPIAPVETSVGCWYKILLPAPSSFSLPYELDGRPPK